MLDKQLRQQREWKRYKAELLAAVEDKPVSRLQAVLGPRRLLGAASDAADKAASAPGSARGGGGGGSPGRDPSSRWKLLDGLAARPDQLAHGRGELGVLQRAVAVRDRRDGRTPRGECA